ncbi:hypothetical protein GCM10009856_20210 [Mycolicibacterium llatzerense]
MRNNTDGDLDQHEPDDQPKRKGQPTSIRISRHAMGMTGVAMPVIVVVVVLLAVVVVVVVSAHNGVSFVLPSLQRMV